MDPPFIGAVEAYALIFSFPLPKHNCNEKYGGCLQVISQYTIYMCRSIKPLFNLNPSVTDEEIRAAALQFVRKVSGYRTPSQINTDAFDQAIDEVALATTKLLASLHTTTEARPRVRTATH